MSAYDEVKSLLESYRVVEVRIRQIEEDIELIRQEHVMPSRGIDGMPRTHKIHDLSDFAVRLDELLAELRIQYDRIIDKKRLVIRLVNELPNETELSILWYRYLRLEPGRDARLMDPAEIGEKFGYSERQVYRYIESGLLHLAEIWPTIKEKYITKA